MAHFPSLGRKNASENSFNEMTFLGYSGLPEITGYVTAAAHSQRKPCTFRQALCVLTRSEREVSSTHSEHQSFPAWLLLCPPCD